MPVIGSRVNPIGAKTEECCNPHGISSVPFNAWIVKFGGMDVSGSRRVTTLETQNASLKQLLAESLLDEDALKDLLLPNR